MSQSNSLTNGLINYLQVLGEISPLPAVQLKDDILKFPDKELFRKLICFILQIIGGFDDLLNLYSKPLISTKVEAQFRNSIKDAISKINQTWPEADLKMINQSCLVAPSGPKVIMFLFSLAKFALKLCVTRTDEVYTPSNNSDESDKIIQLDDEFPETYFLKKIETLTAEIEQKRCDEKTAQDAIIKYIETSTTHIPGVIKEKLEHNQEIVQELKDWREEIFSEIQLQEKEVNQLENFSKCLFEMISLLNEVMEFQTTCLDGNEILKGLGFKSNTLVKIKGVNLVENGQLNFCFLLEFCYDHINETLGLINENSSLNNMFLEVKSFSEKLNEECVKMTSVEQICQECIDKYSPLVEELYRNSLMNMELNCNILKSIADCEKNKVRPIQASQRIEKPVPDLTPPEGDLLDMILRDSEDSSLKVVPGSVKKSLSKSFRSSPSQGNLFDEGLTFKVGHGSLKKSARKTLKSTHSQVWSLAGKKLDLNEGPKKPLVFGVAPLVGLSLANRRVTLGSPQMARRERLKAQYIDQRRQPLLPTTAKKLFASSSPLSSPGECSSFLSGKVTLFGEESKVDVAEDCLLETISSMHSAGGLKLCRNGSTSQEPLTSEALKLHDSDPVGYNTPKRCGSSSKPILEPNFNILKWVQHSSPSSSDSMSQPSPGIQLTMPNLDSMSPDGITPQNSTPTNHTGSINDSVNCLIDQFKQLKRRVNHDVE